MAGKRVAFGLIAAFAASLSGTAIAEEVSITLTGEVDAVCGISDADLSRTEINFGILSNIDAGQQSDEVTNTVSLICNDPDGGTVTISSENGGVLTRTGSSGGSGNEIGYSVALTNGSAISVPPSTLSTPVIHTFLGSPDLISGQPVSISFRANGVRVGSPAGNGAVSTSVYAGIYSDVVRVSVTAN
ncbi:hypothetical protein [Qipengyuania sp. JC766]|uniref:hypothetical protein n=1 Tax=Qipengyuania sp. JC766 TaxID=3232139 RepID=UPI0034588CE4